MTTIVWEFRVLPGHTAEFEQVYGPDGDWIRLFRKAHGYRGTEVLVDPENAGRYVTLDRWESLADYERFKTDYGEEYSALDRRCEALMAQELYIGAFVTAPRQAS